MRRLIIIAIAAVIGAGSLSVGAPILAAETGNPAVEVVADVEPAAAVDYGVNCWSTTGYPTVYATGWSTVSNLEAAKTCMKLLGYARWGWGCASSWNAIKDPFTNYQYFGSAIKKQSSFCGYTSASLNGTGHRR